MVGRTVFYKNAFGGMIGCSKIGFAIDSEYEWRDLPTYNEAWVHFSGNLRGSVVFQQLKTDDPNYPVTVTGMTPTLINYVDLRLNTDGWRDEILGSAGGTYRRETLSSAILSFNYSAKLKVPCNFMLGFF